MIPLGPDAVAVVIGDVAGHSPNAAASHGTDPQRAARLRRRRPLAHRRHGPGQPAADDGRTRRRSRPAATWRCTSPRAPPPAVIAGHPPPVLYSGGGHRAAAAAAVRPAARGRDGGRLRRHELPAAGRQRAGALHRRPGRGQALRHRPRRRRPVRGGHRRGPRDAVARPGGGGRPDPGRRRRAVPAQRRRRDPRADHRRRVDSDPGLAAAWPTRGAASAATRSARRRPAGSRPTSSPRGARRPSSTTPGCCSAR